MEWNGCYLCCGVTLRVLSSSTSPRSTSPRAPNASTSPRGSSSPPNRQLPQTSGNSASKISPRRELPSLDASGSTKSLPKLSPRIPGSGNVVRPLPVSPRPVVASSKPTPTADIFSPTFQVFDKDQDYEDMIKMNELTAESILRNLSVRYAKNKIYTFIGDIVVSVNPYKSLPDLYTSAIMNQYYHKGKQPLPPHVFSVAAAAFENMVEKGLNQSILATGESGAGKTEATKLIVNWFSVVGSGQSDIYKKMVVTSTLLEAFGNAKTVRNHNSSRFGKFFKMQFSSEHAIVGGEIETFLLEQARVTRQNEGERSFHIFYQMFAGMSEAQKQKYALTDPVESFHFVNTCVVNDMNDGEEFNRVVDSLNTLGIDQQSQERIFSVLAGILWLGNLVNLFADLSLIFLLTRSN